VYILASVREFLLSWEMLFDFAIIAAAIMDFVLGLVTVQVSRFTSE
jgi:hypothetical protein